MEWDTALGGRSSLTSVPIRWRPAIFFAVSLLAVAEPLARLRHSPSPRSKRQPHTTLGFIAARQTTTFYSKEPGPDRAGFSIRDGVHGSLLGGRVDPRNAEGDNWLRNGGVSGDCGHSCRGKKRWREPIRVALIEPDISRTDVS